MNIELPVKTREIDWELNLPIAQFILGRSLNCCYFLINHNIRKVILIDASRGIGEVLQDIEKKGYSLQAILLTHSHHDHVLGLKEIKNLPPIYVHEKENFRFQNLFTPDEFILIQEKIKFVSIQKSKNILLQIGDEEVIAHSTPGHSIGALMFEWKNYLFTGDTLFIGTCGRTDFETGSNSDMFESFQYLKKFSENLILCPGHRYSQLAWNTLKDEKQTSPIFNCQNIEELIALP